MSNKTPAEDPEVVLVVNGSTRSVRPGATIADLLDELGLKGRRVAVERNRQIVKHAEWATTPLAEGDRLEILHFVGGG